MTFLGTRTRGRRAHLALVPDSVPQQTKTTSHTGLPVNVVGCWGPAGSPGKSTVAANLACEMALLGKRVLLVDLDTLSPSLAIALGLVDTPAGLSACLRLSRFPLARIAQ